MPRAPSANRPGAAIAVLLAVLACASACRVGPPVGDALLSPFPDSRPDTTRGDLAADGTGGDGPAPCDLLKQDCANQKSCYPVDGVPGATTCELTGSAPPSAFCVMSVECDAREACVFVAESDTTLCATLCDPSIVVTGCPRGAACRLLPGYRVGFCVP